MSHNFPPDFDINFPTLVPTNILPSSEAVENQTHFFVDDDDQISILKVNDLLDVQIFPHKT